MVRTLVTLSLLVTKALALLNATETPTELIISNSRLYASVNKSFGAIWKLTLDGQDLLGPKSGSTGIGPYLDCYCIPSGFYTPGSINPKYQLIKGVDSTNTPYGGIVLSEVGDPRANSFLSLVKCSRNIFLEQQDLQYSLTRQKLTPRSTVDLSSYWTDFGAILVLARGRDWLAYVQSAGIL